MDALPADPIKGPEITFNLQIQTGDCATPVSNNSSDHQSSLDGCTDVKRGFDGEYSSEVIFTKRENRLADVLAIFKEFKKGIGEEFYIRNRYDLRTMLNEYKNGKGPEGEYLREVIFPKREDHMAAVRARFNEFKKGVGEEFYCRNRDECKNGKGPDGEYSSEVIFTKRENRLADVLARFKEFKKGNHLQNDEIGVLSKPSDLDSVSSDEELARQKIETRNRIGEEFYIRNRYDLRTMLNEYKNGKGPEGEYLREVIFPKREDHMAAVRARFNEFNKGIGTHASPFSWKSSDCHQLPYSFSGFKRGASSETYDWRHYKFPCTKKRCHLEAPF